MVGIAFYSGQMFSAENYAMNRQILKDIIAGLKNPAWICFLWAGLTVGISFVAVPEIFTAPLVARPQALAAASVVFAALSRAELVALVMLLIIVRFSGRARSLWVFVSLLALIVLAQSAWLLPELAARTQQIVAGIEPAPSSAHAIYASLEIVKVLLLLVLGFRTLKNQAKL
jgi:hypothetical protein